jgi:catechol 2,3-dioxygenase-like lactoylglutathione lyase family enzyme
LAKIAIDQFSGAKAGQLLGPKKERAMPRVVGIDHLVLSVGDFARSKDFYRQVLGFLGFKLKHEYEDMAGWSNGKTLFWIAADEQGRKHKYRKGDIGFHHYAFELASRKDVDALGAFLDQHGMTVLDPPGEYNGDKNYYAVYFADPDGMKLEGMVYKPAARKKSGRRRNRNARVALLRTASVAVVPAQAGTHNHRSFKFSSVVPHRYDTAYGSPPARGRQIEIQSARRMHGHLFHLRRHRAVSALRRSPLLGPGAADARGKRDLPQMRAGVQRRSGRHHRAQIGGGEKAQRPSRGAGKLSKIIESQTLTSSDQWRTPWPKVR